MDPKQHDAVLALLTRRVQATYPRELCFYTFADERLTVGGITIEVRIRQIADSERSRITMKSTHWGTKVFRETKDGHFRVDRVIEYLVNCVNYETARWRAHERERMMKASAENIIKGFSREFDLEHQHSTVAVLLAPSEIIPGTIVATINGLTQEHVGVLLNFLKDSAWIEPPDPTPTLRLWDHLVDDPMPGVESEPSTQQTEDSTMPKDERV